MEISYLTSTLLLLIAYGFLYTFKHNQKSWKIPFHTDAYTMANNGEMIENGPSCEPHSLSRLSGGSLATIMCHYVYEC